PPISSSNPTAPPEIYSRSLHDALPIFGTCQVYAGPAAEKGECRFGVHVLCVTVQALLGFVIGVGDNDGNHGKNLDRVAVTAAGFEPIAYLVHPMAHQAWRAAGYKDRLGVIQ